MKKIILILAIAVTASFLPGCGTYNMQSTLPDYISTVAVPIFGNKTDQINLEQYITAKTIEELIATAKVRIEDEYKADAVIKCDIVKYVKAGTIFDANQVAQQYRLRIDVVVVFFDNKNQVKLWEEKNIYEETTYYEVNNLGMPAENENIARNRVLDQLAKRIVTRVIYGL